MEDVVLKYVLLNSVEHGGKANVQAVLGKIIAENPEFKKRIKETIQEIEKAISKVSMLSIEEQRKMLSKFEINFKEEKKEYTLPDLPNAEIGKVVMRLAPYPSGPLHIGNARMIILNDEYVKKYKGKLFLVFDDTIGSEEKFVIPEAYEMIIESLNWLGVKVDKVFYKSDRLEIFYKYAEELIKKDIAYVCLCDAETLRKFRKEGRECSHRRNSIEENLELWNKMLKGEFKEGEAVVRLKTDMNHPNPSFRDRVLLRIVEREHPRVGKKYKVWPMLEFSWAIDDYLLGITHILRGKDLVIEDMMEEFIWDKLGWSKAKFIHYGMLNVEEAKLSKTEARKNIEKGIYLGWHDPRTWSLQSLKKRGIQPEAIRKFILNMGLSLADVNVPAEILYSENRKIIDPRANRYFAVLNPVKIKIDNAPEITETEINLHPNFPERGKRKIPVKLDKIYVEKEDFENFKDKTVALMYLLTIDNLKNSKFLSREIPFEVPKIHWVSEPNVKIKIFMPDGSIKEALAEPSIKNVKEDDIIQLVRVGFCRVDTVNGEFLLYFTHK
jgi:glutamyl-tRNA synthetase